VLLGPGAILRIAENSSFRLVADRITDTRLELLAGSALLECAEILKGNRITIVTGGQSATIRKDGLYRFDFDPARLRVYDGEAELTAGGQTLVVKEGRQVALNGLLAAEKFDNKVGDTLYRWSKRRSGYLAVANLSAAKSIRDSGLGWGVSGWRYNPYFGFYTFIPASGIWHSPFGFLYYAPRTVYRVYEQPAVSRGYGAGGFGGPGGPRYNPNLGYDTMSRSSSGSYVGSSASAPVAAAPAPSPRAAESATPRESSGGGRGR
jgi:hypothetical protein